MRKDIEIPEVEGVFMAVVHQYNTAFKTNDWNVYIVNENDYDLEMILIVSRGYDQSRSTSLMRHKLEKLPEKSYAKVELMLEDVLELNNEFHVSFFVDGQMRDKKFVFKQNTINEKALRDIPLMDVRGVMLR